MRPENRAFQSGVLWAPTSCSHPSSEPARVLACVCAKASSLLMLLTSPRPAAGDQHTVGTQRYKVTAEGWQAHSRVRRARPKAAVNDGSPGTVMS